MTGSKNTHTLLLWIAHFVLPWIHFTRTPASTLLLGGQVPDTRGSTLSTGTCVEEGDLAVDTSAFKHMLPCTTSFPSSSNCPGPPQLPPVASQCFHPSRSMCGGMSSLTWGGCEQEGRAKKQRNHQIAHTQRRRQGTEVSLLMSSCCYFSHDSVISRGYGREVHLSLQFCNSQPTFTCGCSSSFKLSTALPRGR